MSVRRLGVSCVLGLAFLLAVPLQCIAQVNRAIPESEMDGPGALYTLGSKIYMSVQSGAFRGATVATKSALASKQRLADGQWVLARLFDGYAEWLQQEKTWDEQRAMLEKWHAADPNSPELALCEATFWLHYAWYARGRDYAGTVPERAWALVAERAAKAREVLERSKPYASVYPVWYSQMIWVAVLQKRPRKEVVAIFDEGVAKEPLFEATYFAMANSMTPKWGGRLDDYHDFVTKAVARTKSVEGDTMYARLYWILINTERDAEPFKTLGISWPKMRSGFDDLMRRYPDSQWNLENYARFACFADDGRTFNSLSRRIDRNKIVQMPDIWRGAFTLDYCTEIFSRRT